MNLESKQAVLKYHKKAGVAVEQYNPVKCRQTCAVLSNFHRPVAIYIASLHCPAFKKVNNDEIWNDKNGWAKTLFSFIEKIGYLQPAVSCLQQRMFDFIFNLGPKHQFCPGSYFGVYDCSEVYSHGLCQRIITWAFARLFLNIPQPVSVTWMQTSSFI